VDYYFRGRGLRCRFSPIAKLEEYVCDGNLRTLLVNLVRHIIDAIPLVDWPDVLPRRLGERAAAVVGVVAMAIKIAFDESQPAILSPAHD